MYSIADYVRMMLDPVRIEAYRKSLAGTLRPGDRVFEGGCGLGVFCADALSMGAGQVAGCDLGPITATARSLLATNFPDADWSILDCDIGKLPDMGQFDLVFSDFRGTNPYNKSNILFHEIVLPRLLKPGGKHFPTRDICWICPVFAPVAFASFVQIGSQLKADLAPYDIGPVTDALLQSLHRINGHEISLLATPEVFGELNYRNLKREKLSRSIEFAVTADAVFHGCLMWFDAELADGIAYTSHPFAEARATAYGLTYFPTHEEVLVRGGDSIRLEMEVNSLEVGPVLWSWRLKT